MTWAYPERGDPMLREGGATAVGSSETFEEFYAREFPAVVGLAFALGVGELASRPREVGHLHVP
jgi:hypothetical protein